eukprot:10849147-Karenia_brevis.AAC.1
MLACLFGRREASPVLASRCIDWQSGMMCIRSAQFKNSVGGGCWSLAGEGSLPYVWHWASPALAPCWSACPLEVLRSHCGYYGSCWIL